jgi:signal transduction histidine kinase
MSRTKLVLGIALLLGLSAIVALVALERRAAGSRSAQVSLANVSTQLTQLVLVPLTATTMPGTAAQKAVALEGKLRAQEQAILATLDRLQRGSPPAELGEVGKPLRGAIAAANAGLPIWVSTKEMGPAAIKILNLQGTTLYAALHGLDDANRAYGARASASENEALGGSVAVVAILLGAFGFFYRRSESSRRRINAQGTRLRLALAELEAAQIDRAQLLHRTVEIAEHERIRVAADLHDGPIQSLTAVTLGFDLLARQLKRGEREKALTLVEQIRETLGAETVSLRRLMTELRPPILDSRNLGAALDDCALQVLDGSAVEWNVDATRVAARLSPELETVVYRVVREALVNVRKHAPGAHASVTLEPAGDLLRLAIVDDGPGFDEQEPLRHTQGARYGLIGMRERVESVGGTWSLATAPGAGTRIEVTLPLKLRADATWREPAGVAA